MKLVIQIPCYKEEATLAATLAALPRTVAWFSSVQVLVVNDGSTDRRAEAAGARDAEQVLRLPRT